MAKSKEIILKPEEFFELSDLYFGDIFSSVSYVWEPLRFIDKYIKETIEKGLLPSGFSRYKNKEDVFIGEGSVIDKSAKILGPAIIGRNCVIAHAAFLRENCLLGDNVKIGHAVEAKNSIVLNHSSIAHLNYVGDSIIGNNVNVGGGAIFANLRFDKKEVVVKYENTKIPTTLGKFGAIIGDNSNIGVNAVLNPGTILGRGTIVFPLARVFGLHKDYEVIK
jgi:NDP-sugar pyrophosphorylase family protein